MTSAHGAFALCGNLCCCCCYCHHGIFVFHGASRGRLRGICGLEARWHRRLTPSASADNIDTFHNIPRATQKRLKGHDTFRKPSSCPVPHALSSDALRPQTANWISTTLERMRHPGGPCRPMFGHPKKSLLYPSLLLNIKFLELNTSVLLLFFPSLSFKFTFSWGPWAVSLEGASHHRSRSIWASGFWGKERLQLLPSCHAMRFLFQLKHRQFCGKSSGLSCWRESFMARWWTRENESQAVHEVLREYVVVLDAWNSLRKLRLVLSHFTNC